MEEVCPEYSLRHHYLCISPHGSAMRYLDTRQVDSAFVRSCSLLSGKTKKKKKEEKKREWSLQTIDY